MEMEIKTRRVLVILKKVQIANLTLGEREGAGLLPFQESLLVKFYTTLNV